MSYLFPIGEIAASTAYGTIDSINYYMFEPNAGCSSSRIYSNLVTTFESQFKLIRKKAEPYITLKYDYSDIFSREYRQVEHFLDLVTRNPTSFYCIDWSKGITPTNVSSGWVVSIPDTTLYTIYEGAGAYRGLLWNGTKWKLGTVSSVSSNTSVTLSVSEGTLTYTEADTAGILYPVYEVYTAAGTGEEFNVTEFIPLRDINLIDDGGFMYSGSVTFMGKYKV